MRMKNPFSERCLCLCSRARACVSRFFPLLLDRAFTILERSFRPVNKAAVEETINYDYQLKVRRGTFANEPPVGRKAPWVISPMGMQSAFCEQTIIRSFP